MKRRTFLTASVAAAAAWGWDNTSAAVAASSVPVKPSDALRQAFGVNTHTPWQWTPYSATAAMEDATVSFVGEVGASHFREVYFPGDAQQARLIPRLTTAGCKMYAIIGTYASTPTDMVSTVRNLVASFPPDTTLRALAGINEPDDGSTWIPHTLDLQKALYGEVRATPALAGIPVGSPALHGANITGLTSMGNAGVDDYSDMVCLHHYPTSAAPFTGNSWQTKLDTAKAAFPGQLVSVDEYGYVSPSTSFPTATPPEWVAATYAPRALCEAVRLGLSSLMWYELFDQANRSKDYNAHFGLVETNMVDPAGWRRKQAFTTFQRIVGLTRDDGPAFTPAPLGATITGTPKTLVLGKRDGTYGTLHWRDDKVYDASTKKAITVTPVPSTVTLSTPRNVTITNVTTGAVQALGLVSKYTASVAGDVLHVSVV